MESHARAAALRPFIFRHRSGHESARTMCVCWLLGAACIVQTKGDPLTAGVIRSAAHFSDLFSARKHTSKPGMKREKCRSFVFDAHRAQDDSVGIAFDNLDQ